MNAVIPTGFTRESRSKLFGRERNKAKGEPRSEYYDPAIRSREHRRYRRLKKITAIATRRAPLKAKAVRAKSKKGGK